jgi:outer membrane biogenesis lipoprotein LolB
MKLRVFRSLSAATALLLLSACTMTAPKYTFSPDAVQMLRGAGAAPVKIGAVSAQGADAHNDSISLRGSGMHSPYGN